MSFETFADKLNISVVVVLQLICWRFSSLAPYWFIPSWSPYVARFDACVKNDITAGYTSNYCQGKRERAFTGLCVMEFYETVDMARRMFYNRFS